MSLQVWLPLCNDDQNLDFSENKGLQGDIEVTQYSVIGLSGGKVGQQSSAFSNASGPSYITISKEAMTSLTTEASVCFWLKLNSWKSNYATFFQAGLGGAPWTHYIFGFLRNAANSTCCFTISNGSSSSSASYLTPELELNTWYHIGLIYKTGHCLIYINGLLYKDYSTSIVPNFSSITTITLGCCNTKTSYLTNSQMNDFRIYDHALSKKEVKEISKGLVLHYPLDNNLTQTLNNCYAYPTFQTSTSTGGWSHWGATGHQGTYGQNTDTNYIFKTGQTYSHWVANGTNATKSYLLYQSPAFAGGIRSLQCICKEENGLEINESIIFPDWNARNGGVPNYKWTSITPLGNGFYHCKCEGIQQDGSNDLIGFDIKPGYKVYISEAYVENNKAICSDIFFSSNIMYDTSGYLLNGILNGTFENSTDTPRYSTSQKFTGTNYISLPSPCEEVKTVSLWVKWDTIPLGQSVVFVDYKSKIGFGLMSTGILCSVVRNSHTFSKANIVANTWYHFVIINPGTVTSENRKLYINGVEQTYTSSTSNWTYSIDQLQLGKRSTTSDGFKGLISDFKMYSSVLNEEDILELYHTSAIADRNNNFYTRNFIEKGYNNLIEYFYNFKKGSGLGILSHESDGLHLDRDIWVHHGSSEYISINPSGKTYKYDVVCSIDAGNQFYIGWERYDADKTARSNNACTYIVGTKPTSDLVYKHYSGTVNLSTDGVNPCAFIRLRILNKWTGSTTDTNGTAIIHSLSLKEYSTSDVFTPVNISKTGLTKSTEILLINNIDKININRTQQINANNFILE